MAIYAITGRPRHGKTLYMARIAAKLLNHGERVFSNLKFNVGQGALKKLSPEILGDYAKKSDKENPKKLLFYWANMHEWEHYEKGNILCDEMQRYFNSRQWDQLSSETELKLQQHGKEDLNIYGTTQHYERIDVVLRQLIEIFYDVETIFGKPNNKKPFLGLKLMRISAIEGIEYMRYYEQLKIMPESKLEIPYKSKLYFFRKKYAEIYDTYAKVGRSEPMPLVHTERKCNYPGCTKTFISHH